MALNRVEEEHSISLCIAKYVRKNDVNVVTDVNGAQKEDFGSFATNHGGTRNPLWEKYGKVIRCDY